MTPHYAEKAYEIIKRREGLSQDFFEAYLNYCAKYVKQESERGVFEMERIFLAKKKKVELEKERRRTKREMEE